MPESIRFIFARRGDLLIVILAGGTKSSRSRDIARAIERTEQLERRMAKPEPKPRLGTFDPAPCLRKEKDLAACIADRAVEKVTTTKFTRLE